jgi:hypothetical protein
MMLSRTRLLTIGLLAYSAQAGAHHSAIQFDMSATISFEAVVTELEWKNPHVFVQVNRIDGDGQMTPLQIEADGASMLIPHRWSRDSLQPGDRVIVEAYPARQDENRSLLGYSITKDDGTVLSPNPDRYMSEQVSSPQAAGIEGTWLPRWAAFFRLRNARLPLTEQGRLFRERPESEQIPLYDCVPFSSPRIMVIPVRSEIEILSDRVLIRVDWLDVERIIYTDGREHPTAGQRTIQGHSIGRWEGDTLVFETTLFSDEAMGEYSLPLSLNADRRTLDYSFTLEDPEYLTAPVSGGGVWDYRPALESSSVACDLEASRRNLEPVE